MNEAIRMQISAFVDGELPDNESELLLRRLCQDAAMRSQVAAYLSIGRAIRGDEEPAGMATLRTRIGEALGEEVVQSPDISEKQPVRFLRPVAGVAIAASVALVALVGLRQVEPAGEIESGTLEDLSAVAIDGGPSYTEPPVVDTLSDSSEWTCSRNTTCGMASSRPTWVPGSSGLRYGRIGWWMARWMRRSALPATIHQSNRKTRNRAQKMAQPSKLRFDGRAAAFPGA